MNNNFKMRIIQALFLCTLTTSSGCALLFPAEAPATRYFLLEQESCATTSTTNSGGRALAIENSSNASLVDPQRIAFSEAPTERGYYQYAFWAKPLADQFLLLVVKQFECDGTFSNITRNNVSSDSDLLLTIELVSFYHDADRPPGTAKVELRADLMSGNSRKVLDTKSFEKSEQVGDYSSDGAVQALNAASQKLSGEILAWVKTHQ